MVLIDSTILSLLLRRKPGALSAREASHVQRLLGMIAANQAGLIGGVRQEVLSGIRFTRQFDEVRERLDELRAVSVSPATHDLAASFANRCAQRGIATSAVDMLLCAAAVERDEEVWSSDRDFARYAAEIAELRLHRDE